MSASPSSIAGRAAELRLAFDRGFAEPVGLGAETREALLAVRIDTQPFAIRFSEISGLFADKKVTPVPGSHAALRGIAGFRGAIVPVYDLQLLLGHAAPSGTATPRWLVIAAAAPVALAFTAYEQQIRAAPDAIMPQPSGAQARGYTREFVRTRKFSGPLLHLPSVLEAIKA
ncbi:MAG TPA: chemotaxis protein CheW [Xanthobacteraceae bacterium]|jgi:chemotaxis signal transduction protein|nr:chemotaxis protein CheW [Xanthobacteraceae bacterium]